MSNVRYYDPNRTNAGNDLVLRQFGEEWRSRGNGKSPKFDFAGAPYATSESAKIDQTLDEEAEMQARSADLQEG